MSVNSLVLFGPGLAVGMAMSKKQPHVSGITA